MPIQRVFSSKGHGTVVTGVPVAGDVRVGDRLEILPPGLSGRVRGLQAYKTSTTVARAGHSTAINLSEVDFHQVRRGMVITEPGYFSATDMLEVRLRVLPHLRQPLRHQMAIRFHTGTLEAVGRLFLLEVKSALAAEVVRSLDAYRSGVGGSDARSRRHRSPCSPPPRVPSILRGPRSRRRPARSRFVLARRLRRHTNRET